MSEKPDLSVEVRLSKGQMVDKYQIVNLIGFGGMGAVYLAIDTDSEYDNAYVALKILYPKLARKSGDFPRRFVREARIASRIQHPNLVKVFECNFSDENGFYYLAQEFVGGGSLRQLVSNDTILSEAEALRIAIGVAQALEAVHKHKVVHRDIKPDNIMFATDGTVKLTDWGIAKRKTFSNAAALDQLELTVNKVFLGTPLYASPEQLQDSRNVDIRSDIYSLGATIYYSLVGKPPFKGTTEIDSLSAVLSKPAPDVRNARPDISDKLAVLLLRMLAKSPAGRPANPTVLLELLLDAGQKYHLRERLGIPASPSSGGVKEAVQGKPVFEVRQASYQPTEATRHSEPPPVSEVTQPPTADSSPEPAAFSEYCPEADAAGNSQKEIIVATAETLPAEKPVAQADRSFETRTARTCKSPVSKTVSREGGEALPSAHVPSRLVAWMIWLILLLVVAFFAAEQWKLPKKRFELCMELGGEALQIHSWQLAIFYYDGASRVPGYENDRRPYLEIIKAKRGMDFAKTARNQRFQELLTMGRQSGTVKDWQKAVELFEAAVSIPGISEKDLTAAKKDLQSAKVNLQQSQRNHIEQLFAQVRTKLKAKEYPEAGKFLETIRKTPFASEEDFRRADELGKEITNSKRLQELLEAGREAQEKKDYLEAEKYFLEALDIPGEHEDTDKVWGWLREVRTARFDELIEKARDQATPVDQAKKYLNEAEQIPGISPERRQEVGKIRAEILENEVGRRKAELQRDYDSSLAKAKELLAQAKSLADYEEVEKLYEQAKRIAVPDRSKVEAGLLKCYRQRNDFLFKAGDAFAARKNWPEARRCYEHVLSGRGVLPEEMEKAKKKILECRKQELLLLLADGEKALRQEDWRGAKDAFKQAIVKAEGDFSKEKEQALDGLRRADNGMKFQELYNKGRDFLNRRKYGEAIASFDQALKIPGFENHPGALKDKKEAHLRLEKEKEKNEWREKKEKEAKEEADRKCFEELIAQADALLEMRKFDEAKEKYREADKVRGYAQNQRVKDGLEKCQNGPRFHGLVEQGKEFFVAGNWEDAAEEFRKALAVKGYGQDDEVKELLDQARKMTTWLAEFEKAKNDFEKVLADLEKEVYFRTGDMRQKYILDLKNVWGKTSDCPVKDIRSKPQEELWGKEILPSLTLVSENLIYHPRVLALTRELRAHARREFLALLEDVDVICQGKIGSLDEKSDLRINVRKFFQEQDLIENPEGLSEGPRRIDWIIELFKGMRQ